MSVEIFDAAATAECSRICIPVAGEDKFYSIWTLALEELAIIWDQPHRSYSGSASGPMGPISSYRPIVDRVVSFALNGGRSTMLTVENCLPLLVAWCSYAMVAAFMERLCSCYFPFLLSARFYYTIKSPKLCGILISPRRNRDNDSETAPEDRNKLPLLGCIYCIVIFPWLLCEIVLLLLFLILAAVGSALGDSRVITSLTSLFIFLFGSKFFWFFITGMPVLYMVDYSLGLRRWQKRE